MTLQIGLLLGVIAIAVVLFSLEQFRPDIIALGILRHLDTARYPVDSADSIHLQVEVMKLAFADRDQWAADPEMAEIPLDRLLDPGYLAQRAGLVDSDRAAPSVPSGVGGGADSGSATSRRGSGSATWDT